MGLGGSGLSVGAWPVQRVHEPAEGLGAGGLRRGRDGIVPVSFTTIFTMENYITW